MENAGSAPGENSYDAVLNFCKNDLKCPVAIQEIDRTHRVGKSSGDSKPQAIIVTFLCFQSKVKVLKHRRNLKGGNKFINEDLTFTNKVLFDFVVLRYRRRMVASDGVIMFGSVVASEDD